MESHLLASRMQREMIAEIEAARPDFRRGVTSPLPSGNVDIVPTLLWLMGIKPPEPLDGRVLSEALVGSAPPLQGVELGRRDSKSEFKNGLWEQYLKFTEVNGVRYLEEGNGRWTPLPATMNSATNRAASIAP